MKRRSLSPAIVLCSLALVSSAWADVLISDNFNNVVSGTNINSRAPTINLLNTNSWLSTTSTFLGDGSGGLSGSSVNARLASIDLGANFFTANPGVYQLSLTITQPSGSTGMSWLALGFSIGNDVGQNFVVNSGNPWALFRLNSNVNFYGGPGTGAQLTNAGGTTVTSTATLDTPHLITLTLNTALTNWTLDGSIDGTAVDLNGTGSAGNTYVYSTNPTGIRYIAIGAGPSGASATGTLDNFSFSGPVPVPEPGALTALLGGSAILLANVRRRVRV